MNKAEAAKLLDKAAEICVKKHAGQRDKSGAAYFQHPMRMAMRCHTDEEKIVALLHDTVEDTDITAEYLQAEGFPQNIIEGILSVTKRAGESYEEFVARAARNPLGRVVKLHDLEDNLDVCRLDFISPDTAARLSKYLAAYKYLTNYLPVELTAAPVQNQAAQTVLTKSESYRNQRARINQRLSRFRSNGGTEYMQNKIAIRMPDGKIISDRATYQSFIYLLDIIGYERVAALGLKFGQYPIVAKEPINNRYKKANAHWYVLANWPTIKCAQYINDIADLLDLYIECDVVAKD
ncbi:MAG: hypothetical protein K2L21_03230 [Muribaculaceae bacterium]|nr:hypothetical protein [Muribaculaceae bacterium]